MNDICVVSTEGSEYTWRDMKCATRSEPGMPNHFDPASGLSRFNVIAVVSRHHYQIMTSLD
jgi:hypothetical protein